MPAGSPPRHDRPWTTFADVRAVLRRRWDRGDYLRRHAAAEAWQPISLPIRGPSAHELLDRLDEATRWMSGWVKEASGGAGTERVRIEHKAIQSRQLGRNDVPSRVWVDTARQLYRLLGVADEVRALDRLLESTGVRQPDLMSWVAAHPQQILDHRQVWPLLLSVVEWVAGHRAPELYLRHIDAAGVDTKFVETYKLILAELLEQVLPADRVDLRYGRADFAGRFRFRRRPDYTRLRLLGESTWLPAGVSEMTLRTDELAALDPPVQTVIIIENEISYLAFPDIEDAIAIFGSGFALTTLKSLLWLAEKEIVYWGDIDTFGLAILSQLRSRFGSVRSILMDHETLLAHPSQWVVEPMPTNIPLPHLTEAEAELYRDLIEDRYGRHVRLEQERVRFSRVRAVLPT